MALLHPDEMGDRLRLQDSFFSFFNTIYSASYFEPEAPGFQGFSFAPDDDAIAIWYPDQIEVKYCFAPASMFCSESSFFTSLNFSNSPDAVSTSAGRGAWSPDSRLLAFTDENGLWLWDVYLPEASPKLFLESENQTLPYALHFSPSGRYLAVEQGMGKFYVDTMSDIRLPYGFFSPDEHHFVAPILSEQQLATFEIEETESLYCDLAPFSCYGLGVKFEQVTWISNHAFIAIYHYPADEAYRFGIDEKPFGLNLEYSGMVFGEDYSWLNASYFDYDPYSNIDLMPI